MLCLCSRQEAFGKRFESLAQATAAESSRWTLGERVSYQMAAKLGWMLSAPHRALPGWCC